jgi:hypothetical protein
MWGGLRGRSPPGSAISIDWVSTLPARFTIGRARGILAAHRA